MSECCATVHHLFNSLQELRFPFEERRLPLNGIYILFEKGELAHGGNRIVRVGSHTGDSQLRSRLKQHFLNENKDRSIFRKNIGRCLLNRERDPFLAQWELDLTSKESKDKHVGKVDLCKLQEIERKVSKYIRDNFSFVAFRVDDKEERLVLESRIISTVSLCNECGPSQNWLGLFSPREKIRRSGLWLVNELYKESLSAEDVRAIGNVIQDLKIHKQLRDERTGAEDTKFTIRKSETIRVACRKSENDTFENTGVFLLTEGNMFGCLLHDSSQILPSRRKRKTEVAGAGSDSG